MKQVSMVDTMHTSEAEQTTIDKRMRVLCYLWQRVVVSLDFCKETELL